MESMKTDMHVISVDDNAINLLLIETLLKDLGLKVTSFPSAKEALAFMNTTPADIILTDYMMPEMHGIDLIRAVRDTQKDVPIVMITAVTDDSDLKLEALEAGATEFLNKPLNPAEFKARLLNLVNLRKAQILLQNKALLLSEEVRKAVRLVEQREHETLYVLGRASEYKDMDTATHINRVACYSAFIVKELGSSIYEQELIFNSARLHDVGKIGIPDDILLKPGRYTEEEFEIMKKHPIIGYEMLKGASSPYLQQGAEIALSHHEKFNGKGYPYGLAGEQIPLTGRILAVADVFDALTTKRPYKEAWSVERAVDLLKEERGEHFDPKIVDLFLNNLDKVMKIYNMRDSQTVTFESLKKAP